jgi:type III secretion system FlhB-like substrate exporter
MNDTPPLKLFLRYPGGSKSSRRIVEGQGELAKRVSESAKRRKVPVGENADLLQLLARVDFGESPSLDVMDVIAGTINWLRAGGEMDAPGAEVADSDAEMDAEVDRE